MHGGDCYSFNAVGVLIPLMFAGIDASAPASIGYALVVQVR